MEGPAKFQGIMIIVLSLTAIGLAVALILITSTKTEMTQDAKEQVTIGDITNTHSESKIFLSIASVVSLMCTRFPRKLCHILISSTKS